MEAGRWLADRGFGRSHVPIEVRPPEHEEEIVIESPIFSMVAAAKEAQDRELEAARPALPPGAE